mmetsp:Transcript_31438/g.75089  ORF Transcript_31438/g.75089 Transcript_31438/m.75089 type:complete len:81 (+) Transcript_31438:2-244(+)
MVRSSEESLHMAFIKCHVLLCILIGSYRDRDDYLCTYWMPAKGEMCGHQSNLPLSFIMTLLRKLVSSAHLNYFRPNREDA